MMLPLIIGVGYLGLGSLTSLYIEYKCGRDEAEPKYWIVLDILFWPLLWWYLAWYLARALFIIIFGRPVDKR